MLAIDPAPACRAEFIRPIMIGGKEATRYYTEAIIFCTTGFIVSPRLVFWPNEFGPTIYEISLV